MMGQLVGARLLLDGAVGREHLAREDEVVGVARLRPIARLH